MSKLFTRRLLPHHRRHYHLTHRRFQLRPRLHYGQALHLHRRFRIRFIWNGSRRSETLLYPPTQKGIKSASQVVDQVKGLIKLGLLDDDKYAEFFPSSSNVAGGKINNPRAPQAQQKGD